MKRLILTTFIIVATLVSTNAQQVSIQYSRHGQNDSRRNAELRALRNFEEKLDQFSYSMMVGNVWLAQKTKKEILHSIEMEIRKTQREIDELGWIGSAYSKKSNQTQYRNRTGSIYSKRKGISQNFELDQLMDQIETQKWIKYNFEYTNLIGNRRRGVINERKHRKLMYEFRDLMLESLEQSGRERRRG